MKHIKRIAIFTAAAASLAVSGCVDVESESGPDSSTTVRKQAVTVVPEFSITGSESMPETLHVTELGLVISEIRLEPMSTSESFAYSTRDPMLVEFDVARGQTTTTTETLELPSDGRYLVSIRLEPTSVFDESGASFNMHGYVSGEGLSDEPEILDGRPQPMPFDPERTDDQDGVQDRQAFPNEWTPFEYHSKRAVFFTFNDVVLEPGEQTLTFSFDVRDWALEVAEPISNAVRANEADDDSVDVTQQVDNTGYGVEALIETGVVQAGRRPGQ